MSKKDNIDYDTLYKIAKDGFTMAEIAETLGVSDRTVYRWINEDKKFSQTLKAGKVIADKRVEDALYKNALGFEYEEVKIEDISIDTPNESIKLPARKITRTTKLITPNTTAQIFWLKNRKPDEWRDSSEVKHSGDLTIALTERINKARERVANLN